MAPLRVENGSIILGTGYMTGINWTKPFPTHNYEVRLEAVRLDGYDFFAGITFPVFDSFCSWINGGWGGNVVGLSSLDTQDASENDTSFSKKFEKGRWYKLRFRVTDAAIEAWIDEERVIHADLAGREISLRPGDIELSKPFGIASYETVAGLRKIEYRLLAPQENASVTGSGRLGSVVRGAQFSPAMSMVANWTAATSSTHPFHPASVQK